MLFKTSRLPTLKLRFVVFGKLPSRSTRLQLRSFLVLGERHPPSQVVPWEHALQGSCSLCFRYGHGRSVLRSCPEPVPEGNILKNLELFFL